MTLCFIQSPGTKFLDTLSLHVCVAGQTSHQKGIWLSKKKKLSKVAEGEDIPTAQTRPSELWTEVSSPNSLVEVHWLHVRRGKKRMNKTQRNVFVKGSMQDIRDDFQVCTHSVVVVVVVVVCVCVESDAVLCGGCPLHPRGALQGPAAVPLPLPPSRHLRWHAGDGLCLLAA